MHANAIIYVLLRYYCSAAGTSFVAKITSETCFACCGKLIMKRCLPRAVYIAQLAWQIVGYRISIIIVVYNVWNFRFNAIN